jgi:hypothetical protein
MQGSEASMILIVGVSLLCGVVCIAGGFIVGVYTERRIGTPLWQREDVWSIGIYTGDSPIELASPAQLRNPVLSAKHVNGGIKARFVADPFLVRNGTGWDMFLEVLDAEDHRGKIGHASSSDGFKWTYNGIVLREPWHLSYPYVFKWEGHDYMVPACPSTGALRLYRARSFPADWEFLGPILTGRYADPSFFRHDDRWWLFASDSGKDDTLRLFMSNELQGPWVEHPKSPVIRQNKSAARAAGRVINWNGRLIRYTQDCKPAYGSAVRAFEITELTETSYQEVLLNTVVEASGTGWNAHGMHQVDAQQLPDGSWIAAVDGCRRPVTFRLKW